MMKWIRLRLRRWLHAESDPWYRYAVIVQHGFITQVLEDDIPLFGALVLRRHLAQGQAYHLAMTLRETIEKSPGLPGRSDG